MDQAPKTYPANVTFQNGSVCVTVTPEKDEKLEAISVYRLDSGNDRKPYFSIACVIFQLINAYLMRITNLKKRYPIIFQ